MGEAVHPLRAWREDQKPKLTLDAAAAAVGTVRQVWFDWEVGRRIPRPQFMSEIYRFTRGAVRPDHFYNLPPIGQMPLPFDDPAPVPLFDGEAQAAAPEEEPHLQVAA